MTHDELLAKIQWTWNHNLDGAFVNAIEAVVELHKPNDILCSGCVATLYENCRTIQAIQKELQ